MAKQNGSRESLFLKMKIVLDVTVRSVVRPNLHPYEVSDTNIIEKQRNNSKNRLILIYNNNNNNSHISIFKDFGVPGAIPHLGPGPKDGPKSAKASFSCSSMHTRFARAARP